MSLRRFFLAALAFLPGGWSVQARTVPLGVVFKGDDTIFYLPYVNRGQASVHIAHATTYCDCLEMLQAPGDVAAGETKEIPLVHHAANVGTIEVTIQLTGEDASTVIATDTVTGFVADRSWLLSPREVQQDQSVALIDTRSPDEFGRLHIAHATNIPTFALKTKTNLRLGKLVLVDDGVSSVELLAEVAVLRQQGFAQVFALSGGLPAWMRAGGRVEGSGSVLDVARISAANFVRASRAGKWRVVEVSETDAIERSLVALAADAAGGMPPHILIVAPTNASHAAIEAHLGQAGRLPVFYLTDGAPALALFHDQQIAAARNSVQLFTTKAANNAPVIAGGCSSCGK